MIIGLAGPNASGKGEVAAYLESLGYAVHSLSDVVREEAAARGLPPEREHLIRTGQELRRREGPGVLAEHILARLESPAVVDSIRSPGEVEVLRRLEDFRLLAIEAPVELRWRRAMDRRRAGDATTLEAFRLQEEKENQDRPDSQQVRRAIALADEKVSNDGSLTALRAQVDAVVSAWKDELTALHD